MTYESIRSKYVKSEKNEDTVMFDHSGDWMEDDSDDWMENITPEEDEFLWNYFCQATGLNMPNPCPKKAVKQDPLNEH